MNEKLTLHATVIEHQQQQQQQHQQQQLPQFPQQPHVNASTLELSADYHFDAAMATAASYTLDQQLHNNSDNSNATKSTLASSEFVGIVGIGDGHSNTNAPNTSAADDLLCYTTVASLGGFMGVGGGAAATTPAPTSLPSAGILKSSSNSNNNSQKGSNMNSPHKQQQSASSSASSSSHIANYCGCCFGRGAAHGDKQPTSLPVLTFWPALLANLGICTLLLGYLLIGSFLFLTIETSGDGGIGSDVDSGSAAGAVLDSNAWHYAQQQNAYISIQQQQQQQHQQHQQQQQQHQHQYEYEQAKLYKTNHQQLAAEMAAASAAAAAAASVSGATIGGMPQHNNNYDNNKQHTMAHVATNGTATLPLPFGAIVRPETETTYIDSSSSSNSNSRRSNNAKFGINGAAVAAVTAAATMQQQQYDITAAEYQTLSLAEAEGADGEGGSSAHAVDDVALQRTVENIWDITVSLNILYKENWTKLAALEINKFQDQLVKRLVMDLTLSTGTATAAAASSTASDVHYRQQQQRERYWQLQAARQRQLQQHRLQQQQQQFEWNFATAFLYSLTVVTTVGYGTITPRSTLGRMVTILYATLGIPLTLVYLSSIGSILAKLAGGLCARLLCARCCCATSSGSGGGSGSQKRHTLCGGFGRQQQVSDKKCNLKLKQLQQQQQQQHQTATATSQAQSQTTALPYCYVRPPAELDTGAGAGAFDTLSYPPSGSESLHSHQRTPATLRWSLVLPVGLCALLLLAYVAFGSLVIALLEHWTLFDGVYFCFMSLTTIGFCDLLPGVRPAAASSSASTFVIWFCAVYILSGLTLTSMCVNMLHEEFLLRMRVVVKFKKIIAKNSARERSFYGAPP